MIYYTATPAKFILLSLCSFGVYQFYWFHRNWKLYKTRTARRIMPAWRAAFAPLWAYASFKDITSQARDRGIQHNLHPVVSAAIYIVLLLCWKLPDPYALISALSFAPMLGMNNLARATNRAAARDFQENRRLGFRHWLLIFFGGLCFLFTVVVSIGEETGVLDRYLEPYLADSPYHRMLGLIKTDG